MDGDPAGRFEAPYRVRFDEAGPDGFARASSLLRYVHDVAWQHSGSLGFDQAWYRSRGLGWLVRTVDLDLRRPIPAGSRLLLGTEVVGHGRIWARRRSAAWRDRSEPISAGSPEGLGHDRDATAAEPVTVGLTDWVLIDSRGRPTRLPPEFLARFGSHATSADLARVEIGQPSAAAVRDRRAVRGHELDPNRHVNNAVLLDWMDDAVRLAGGSIDKSTRDWVPRRYRVEYLAPLGPGDAVELAAWPAVHGWSVLAAHADDGRTLARGQLLLGAAKRSVE
jgi:acyl-CoA thioesterase FadM